MKEKETETKTIPESKTMTKKQSETLSEILEIVIPQIKNSYSMEELIKKFS